jgi:polysaccharide pyruvyl transferase WcaK-like protein
MKKKLLFMAGNQPGNLGDIMLDRGLLNCLQKLVDVTVDYAEFPPEEAAQFKLTAETVQRSQGAVVSPRNPKGLLQLLKEPKRYDVVCFYPGILGYGSTGLYLKTRLRVLLACALMRLKGIQVMYPSVGFPLHEINRLVVLVEGAIARLCLVYATRDRRVADCFQARGVSQIEYLPDVFFLNQQSRPSLDPDPSARKKVLFSLRDEVPEAPEEKETFARKIVERAVALVTDLSRDFDVTLSYQCGRDRAPMSAIAEQTRHLQGVTFHDELLDADCAYALYKQQDMIISNRLHCVLFAYIVGAAGIAMTDVARHDKLVGAMRTYEMEDYCLDVHDSDQALADKTRGWLQDSTARAAMSALAKRCQSVTSERFGALLGTQGRLER